VHLCLFFLFFRDRASSPDQFRSNRTSQLIEEDFGISGSPAHKIKTYRASSIAGKYSEDRIIKRAVQEVKTATMEESDYYRAVSSALCKMPVLF
jgi:hypothetical protein